jgi:hypothetical protein
VLASSAQAQRGLTDIPDPDPEIERKSFQVAEGFEVNLFAADPVLAKPMTLRKPRLSGDFPRPERSQSRRDAIGFGVCAWCR